MESEKNYNFCLNTSPKWISNKAYLIVFAEKIEQGNSLFYIF